MSRCFIREIELKAMDRAGQRVRFLRESGASWREVSEILKCPVRTARRMFARPYAIPEALDFTGWEFEKEELWGKLKGKRLSGPAKTEKPPNHGSKLEAFILSLLHSLVKQKSPDSQ